MSKKLKVVVAGLGRIGWAYHLPQIKANDKFELLAVADPLPERLKEAVDTFQVPRTYATVEAMLDAEKEADLLVLTSPTSFHAAQTLYAFERGIDVFCEKPLAKNLDEAKMMAEAMKKYGRKLMIYQPHRVRPEAQVLRSILESGVLGEVFMTRRTCHGFSRRNDWQSKLEFGGGMLNNYGAHFVDQFMYVFGGDHFNVTGCELRREVSVGDADDVAKILLVNPAGVIGDIDINMASAIDGHEWLVYGKNGAARLDNAARCWRVRYVPAGQMPELAPQGSLAAANRKYASEEPLPWHETEIELPKHVEGVYYEHVYDHFALDKKPFVPIEATLELMRINAECRRIAGSK